MGNLFDGLASSAFGTVAKTMGYDAIWQPSEGEPKTARVLYRDPSQDQKVGPITFMPNEYVMEYKLGDFDGLKEAADSQSFPEVSIEGRIFQVLTVDAIADGRTFQARMQPKLV